MIRVVLAGAIAALAASQAPVELVEDDALDVPTVGSSRLADASLNEADSGFPSLGGLAKMAKGALSKITGGSKKSTRPPDLDMSWTMTRQDSCVFCEMIVQSVEAKLRMDPFLGYVGPPEDYPFEDTGSIFGTANTVQQERSTRRSYPVPPIPASMRGGPITSMQGHVITPPPPFVTPPRERLTPTAIAAGKGQAQDATVVIAQATLRKAAADAIRTFALPGANGASFEGGIANLAGKNRPEMLAPVDPNELLVPAGVSHK